MSLPHSSSVDTIVPYRSNIIEIGKFHAYEAYIDNINGLGGLGTAATLDYPPVGDAADTQVVLGSDTRLSRDITTSSLTIYVDAAVAASGDGSSWAQAFKTLAEMTDYLSNRIVYSKSITGYIRGGTYNEPLILSGFVLCGQFIIYSDTSDVIITGSTETELPGIYASAIISNGGPGYINLSGDVGRQFVLTPVATTNNYIGMRIRNSTGLFINHVVVNMASVSAALKYGFGIRFAMGVTIQNVVVNDSNAAFSATTSNIYTLRVSGVNNTTAFAGVSGSLVNIGSNITISATTMYNCDSSSAICDGNGVVFSSNLDTITTLASNTTIVLGAGKTYHISGNTTIETITPQSPIVSGREVNLIPDGLFSLGITGNIAVAVTAEIGKVISLIYDATTSKWYPWK